MARQMLEFHPLSREILLRNGRGLEKEKLEGVVRLSFSAERECVGYKSELSWHLCPNSAVNTRQCPTCSFRDISRIYTVGDFSNYPHKEKELEGEIYSVYLAGFGEDKVKCGITRKARLEERLLEQGADFGCGLFEIEGPERVYQVEQRLQWNFGLANAVRMREKIARLSFDREKGKKRFLDEVERICSSKVFYDLAIEPQVMDFSGSYPKSSGAEESEKVEGLVFGSKGGLLFWKDFEGKEYFVNMKSKEGRFLM